MCYRNTLGPSPPRTGDPYLRVFLPDGVLLPGQSIVSRDRAAHKSYTRPIELFPGAHAV